MTYLSWKKPSQNGLHEPINRYNHGISPDHSKLEHLKCQQKKHDIGHWIQETKSKCTICTCIKTQVDC